MNEAGIELLGQLKMKSESENCKSGHLSTNSEKRKWKMQIRSLLHKKMKSENEKCKSVQLSTKSEK